MSARNRFGAVAVLALGAATPLRSSPNTSSAQQAIDTKQSVITVRVYRAGLFSAFGHDHEIAAPVAGGRVNTAAHQVELRVDASTLRVTDSKASGKDRNEIQRTMLGAEVLDVERYPEIVFRSTAVEPLGPGSWSVRGTLTLHGQTRPVAVEVRENAGHYIGNSLLKQTDFGIRPVRIAGGTIRVKDEIRVEFDIQLAHSEVTRGVTGLLKD